MRPVIALLAAGALLGYAFYGVVMVAAVLPLLAVLGTVAS
jgi:hypothetical protein